jgi:glycogen(starch) synthase
MNIAYFVDEFPPFFRGGLGTYSMEMASRYTRMGHSVTVFSRNTGKDVTRDNWRGIEVHRPMLADMTDVLQIIVPDDVKRWPIGSQAFFAETLSYNILSANKLINLLVGREKRNFDLVVSHDWLAAIGGIMAKEALNKPFVFHLHSVEQGRTGDGSPTIKEIERLGGKIANAVVTVSYAMRDQLISLGFDEKKIRVVHNGVDQDKYSPDNKLVSKDKVEKFREEIGVKDSPMILFLGRLSWVKGADTLVEAMPKILKEVPNAKLVILGRGDQEAMLRSKIMHLNIQDHVITHFKMVDENERLLYYAACDVAVFPSKYEPFGIVCLEAMSLGKPVIVGAAGVSGFREQIVPSGPERCGSHINPYDPLDVAKFTVELLKKDDMRLELGKNARKRVLEYFTNDKAAAETIEVYEEIAAAGITEKAC